MTKKVAITDYLFSDLRLEEEILNRAGASLVYGNCRTEEDVIQLAKDAFGIIYYQSPITKKVIESLEQCAIIVRRAIGVDDLDLAEATRKGIFVCNIPDYCLEEVSDHALTLILCLQRRLIPLHQAVREGRWDYYAGGTIFRLKGKTLGILGFGRIGRLLAKKARSLGCRLIAHDPYINQNLYPWVKKVSFVELLEQSDFLSIHLPLTEKTKRLIGEKELKRMKQTSFLINTSRGGVIDEEALYRALTEGWISGAALDVLTIEPPVPGNPLLGLNNVIITPHAAFYSEEALLALRKDAVYEVVRVLKGKVPKNIVNPEVKSLRQ